jgi:hypothetical protein
MIIFNRIVGGQIRAKGYKMSSTPNKPAGTTLTTILTILEGSNGYVQLAVTVAGVLIPLGKALIQKIEGIGTGSITITFSDLITADNTELDAIAKLSTDELTAINAELTRLGLPTLTVPLPPTSSGA